MILNQTFKDLELIISDDHSTDNTPEVAAALAKTDSRVRYYRPSEKGGVAKVINEAILISKGEYIQICHDHDIYISMLTEKMACLLDRHPTVVFVHPGRQGCDHLGKPLPNAYFVCSYPEVSDGRTWRRKMLKRHASPVTALCMIRRSALETIGLFDPEYGACTDVDMWLRLCAIGDVGYVNELLLFVRGRSPDHPFAGINWAIMDQVIRAHRKHLKLCYQGIYYYYWKYRREIQNDFLLLFSFLNCFRHSRWGDVERGRLYLRKHGPLFSRLAGWIL